jgi:hypothetical protein
MSARGRGLGIVTGGSIYACGMVYVRRIKLEKLGAFMRRSVAATKIAPNEISRFIFAIIL